MKYRTPFSEYDVTLKRSTYQTNKTLAVCMFDETDGSPVATITVNIDDLFVKANAEEAFVDTNNCPGIEQFLIENDIAEPVGIYGMSGYCTYPLYRFNIDKIPVME